MKFYVYAGYYENFISGHKLPKPYILRDEFKTFDEALNYVLENFDDDLLFTKDVINYAINNGIIDDYNLEDYLMKESKELARKSIKESINGDCYIYYDDDDDNKRLVFCDYVKGITDTRNWFYLNEYIIDAIHVFKNEKQAQKFIDEHLKYFADQDKVVIAEYPQTVSGFFESKKSARKSIKESSVRCVTFEQIVDSRFDDISKGEKILNDRKDEIIELCDNDFSVYTKKIEFLDWGDDESQYRQRYYIRKNNNNVSWNDLYEIVNSVKAVPYKFDKINDSVFESRKSIKESKIMSYKDFQDVCIEESENDIINFHEYKGAYFVILRTEEECERLLRILRDKYRFEGTCYKIIDPYNPNYKCYEIMCV